MKNLRFLVAGLLLSLLFIGCSVSQPSSERSVSSKNEPSYIFTGEPQPIEEVKEATVPLIDYSSKTKALSKASDLVPTLTPETLTATLKPGESICEHKVAFIPGAPPKGELVFCLDLTGSMGGELANVKVNSINIMNKIKSIIPDMRFAAVSHMDYTKTYSGGGYSALYGSSNYGDYPYRLDQALTGDLSLVSTALSNMKLGSGSDEPEDYTRVLYESYADLSLGWTEGTKKFYLTWNDAIPHDLDYKLDGSGTSTGPDPGRDEIQDTADDLNLANVLQTMGASNITLIALHSGGYLSLWQKYASYTSGSAFQINSDGTIPGGQDIGEFIAQKILENVQRIRSLSLKVVTPGFEDWLTYSNPEEITNVNLNEAKTFEFDIEITVPDGTPDGVYTFEVGIVGDGAIYATQKVTITVVSKIEVPVDIKPASIPNPINVHDRGFVCVAICGTKDFNISNIDVTTIQLAGVSPYRVLGYQDVATPYYPFVGKPLDKMAGTNAGADGYTDLVLKFKNQDIVKALGEVEDNEVLILKLYGKTLSGSEIVGEDVIWVIDKHCKPHHHKHRHHHRWIRWCPHHHLHNHCKPHR